VFGAALVDSGARLVFVDVDAALVASLREHGVTVERAGEGRTLPVEAVTDAAEIGTADAVLVCVKGYRTVDAAELVAPAVGPATIVASVQNGWGNGDALAQRFAPTQVVLGVTYNSATVVNGTVNHAGTGVTLFGPYAGDDSSRARWLSELLRRGGLESEAVADVGEEIWKKLILNAATLPTAALTGLPAGGLFAHAPMLEIVDGVTREATGVAQAMGYRIDADERIALIHDVLERVGDGKASMLQDLEAGRRTEVETVTGAVVRAAAETDVDVPLNRALYALVRGVERARGLA
jgi:2-dehydropantoate 2-reductase